MAVQQRKCIVRTETGETVPETWSTPTKCSSHPPVVRGLKLLSSVVVELLAHSKLKIAQYITGEHYRLVSHFVSGPGIPRIRGRGSGVESVVGAAREQDP